ncbi:hypothetical protein [Mesorhizobium shangrilense]|uniref:hypothetical protein n=1 Tax=Mesorhizobium shangrilense TaxID=460060 RepID=UPI003394BEAA
MVEAQFVLRRKKALLDNPVTLLHWDKCFDVGPRAGNHVEKRTWFASRQLKSPGDGKCPRTPLPSTLPTKQQQ